MNDTQLRVIWLFNYYFSFYKIEIKCMLLPLFDGAITTTATLFFFKHSVTNSQRLKLRD